MSVMAEKASKIMCRHGHVLHESLDAQHDEATGEAWLHARFTYALYR
jgi:hypothetical protein